MCLSVFGLLEADEYIFLRIILVTGTWSKEEVTKFGGKNADLHILYTKYSEFSTVFSI